MPVEAPTLEELVARVIGDIDTTSPELFATIPQTPMNVFAKAEAGLIHGLYGYVEYLFRMALPTTAEDEYLDRWGDLLGLPRLAATKARFQVRADIASNGTIPQGILWQRSDGYLYETESEVVTTTPTEDFYVVATETGEEGSILINTLLRLTDSVTGLTGTATVLETADGEDVEENEPYRIRILELLRNPPQGGAATDYIAWAKSVAGVGGVWVLDATPPFVDVRISSNDEDNLEPEVGLVTSVQEYIDSVRPVTAIPVVTGIVVVAQNVAFTSLTPNTAPVRAAVQASIEAFFASDTLRQADGVTLYLTALMAAIQNADGVTTFELNTPAADVTFNPGEIPVLGSLTFP